MSDTEIKRLIAARGQCKASFTRLEKYLDNIKDPYLEDLQVRKKNLADNYSNYMRISIDLEMSGEEVDPEDGTEERYLTLMARLERNIAVLAPALKALPQKDNEASDGKYSVAKLPRLDIPCFDGKNIASYKPFIEMFKAVVDSESNLTDIQRLCFLKNYLRGEALQLIDALPIIGKSYKSAIDLLDQRYNNPALLINAHVSKLLDLPVITRGTACNIRDFITQVRQHTTALVTLDQPVEEWNALLSCILLRKLDQLTVRLFQSDRDTTAVVTLVELLTFLEKRAAAMEASPSVSEKSQGKAKSLVNFSTANKTRNNAQCSMCSGDHKLFKCPKFLELSIQKRIEYVNNHNLCKVCLVAHTQKCRYKFTCSVCNSSLHNTLIHHADKAPVPEANVGEKCTNQVNLHVSQPVLEGVLLPTAKVLVTGADNKTFVVRALLDSGSQTSFCTAALAKKLGLPLFELHKGINTLGDACNTSLHKGIKLHIKSLINNFQFDIACSVINKITSRLPQRQIDLSYFVIPKHVALADKEFFIPGEVSLLLASDIFFKIIIDGKIEGGPADPVLLNTQLGYIVSSTGYSHSNTGC